MKKTIVAVGSFLLPVIAFAQVNGSGSGSTNSTQLFSLLAVAQRLFNTLIPILITLGVIYFIWGVIQYVIAKDEEAKKAGRDKMIWGIIGLFVIVSIWGLVGFLGNTLGVKSGGSADVPCVLDTQPGTPGCQS